MMMILYFIVCYVIVCVSLHEVFVAVKVNKKSIIINYHYNITYCAVSTNVIVSIFDYGWFAEN